MVPKDIIDESKTSAVSQTQETVEILINNQNKWIKKCINDEIEQRSIKHANHKNDGSEEDPYNSDSSFDINSFDLYDLKTYNKSEQKPLFTDKMANFVACLPFLSQLTRFIPKGKKIFTKRGEIFLPL